MNSFFLFKTFIKWSTNSTIHLTTKQKQDLFHIILKMN